MGGFHNAWLPFGLPAQGGVIHAQRREDFGGEHFPQRLAAHTLDDLSGERRSRALIGDIRARRKEQRYPANLVDKRCKGRVLPAQQDVIRHHVGQSRGVGA